MRSERGLGDIAAASSLFLPAGKRCIAVVLNSLESVKARTAVPLRGGGRRGDLGSASIPPGGVRIARIAVPSDIRELTSNRELKVTPFSDSNGLEDEAQTIGRPKVRA